MAEAAPKTDLLTELKARVQVDQKYDIMVDGQPFPIALPGVLHWASLAAAHPAISAMLRGLAPPLGAEHADDVQIQADTVGMAIALREAYDNGRKDLDPDRLMDFVEFAKHMVPYEREEAFLTVFMESNRTYKRFFLEATAGIAEDEGNPGATGNRQTRRAAAKKKPAPKRKAARSTASSS